MKGILVRIGIDSTRGNWNAPVDPETRKFIYVPIPAYDQTPDDYEEIIFYLTEFCKNYGKDLYNDLRFPTALENQYAHLDPDFEYLTYGDVGTRRGSGITTMDEGDLIAFYGGLKPIKPSQHKLVYALMGLYIIDEINWALDVPKERWHENAHTRKQNISMTDIIVRAKPNLSGRLERCIPIGEYRNRAYRVRNDLLTAWGGLSVKNGYIQRSIVPPSFLKPEQFYSWFKDQNISLLQVNNYE
jgi:hypothetical protein